MLSGGQGDIRFAPPTSGLRTFALFMTRSGEEIAKLEK